MTRKKEIDTTIDEFNIMKAVNPRGYVINKACISCQYKSLHNPFDDDEKIYNDKGERYCINKRQKVSKWHLCPKWEMSLGLQRAGDIK